MKEADIEEEKKDEDVEEEMKEGDITQKQKEEGMYHSRWVTTLTVF